MGACSPVVFSRIPASAGDAHPPISICAVGDAVALVTTDVEAVGAGTEAVADDPMAITGDVEAIESDICGGA